jgi:hypothetical protein
MFLIFLVDKDVDIEFTLHDKPMLIINQSCVYFILFGLIYWLKLAFYVTVSRNHKLQVFL